MKNFALIGAAGYVAPRHLRAIKETGNNLVAALDPNDTVGVLDSYFPDTRFFTEFERFDRHIDLLRRNDNNIDFVSITSPNYLHDSHARFAMRVGANAICEKPLVVNPWNLEGLRTIEEETGLRVFTILQLRLHPSLISLRQKVRDTIERSPATHFDVDLTYITSRGAWYFSSWKGEENKSGGVAANIGVHFYDFLIWVFGVPHANIVTLLEKDWGSGVIEFENATVRWFLSLNPNHLPEDTKAKSQRTYRSITIDDEEVEFSDGFTDLHTESYRQIIAGNGFGIEDASHSINLVHSIRSMPPSGLTERAHPIAKRVIDG